MSDNQAYGPEPAEKIFNGSAKPLFSVILPTRNRPDLFRRALDSVLRQSCQDIEVLVVNDGSTDEFLPCYRAMEASCDSRVSWHYQPQRSNGHGPSYSINTGAQLARGQYLCILDDDDTWEAVDHLAKARDVINMASSVVDVYYSNQQAYSGDGTAIEKNLWLAVLGRRLDSSTAGAHGTHQVGADFLLGCNGFPHLNCTIIRRELYLAIGAMDEGIRYECEVDLYLRTLSAAKVIIYNPAFVARHNVPDAVRKSSVSTSVTIREKRLSQIRVYEKNLARSSSTSIRDACRSRLSLLYKELAQQFVIDENFFLAVTYARIALAYGYSIKWQAYCLYLELKLGKQSFKR